MNRYRWWHRLRGHKIQTPFFDPTAYGDISSMIAGATTVADVCTCGDQWVFCGLSFTETYMAGDR